MILHHNPEAGHPMTTINHDDTEFTLHRVDWNNRNLRLSADIRSVLNSAPTATVTIDSVTADLGDEDLTDLGFIAVFEAAGRPPLIMAWYEHTVSGLDIHRTYHQGDNALNEALASLASAESVNTAVRVFGGGR